MRVIYKDLTLHHYSRKEGLVVPELGMALDGHRPCEWSFVSHAHADHVARHEKILCSERTGLLLRKRFGIGKDRIETLTWSEVKEVNGYEIRLFPAGHIFGSAMILLTRLSDKQTLLYTGDFKTRKSRTAEAPVFPKADTMIMETTYGLPKYVFPAVEETEREIKQFVLEAIENEETPIIFGYSLGKAQEAIALLAELGVPTLSHSSVAKMTEVIRQEIPQLPAPLILEKEIPSGYAVVCPPNAVRSQVIRKLKKTRTAMLSGWGLNPGSEYRYRVNRVFPLSDHGDYEELMTAVKAVQPKNVVTLHGFAREFARDLRELGYNAWSLWGDDQTELSLGLAKETGTVAEGDQQHTPQGEFGEFITLIHTVGKTASQLKKVEAVSHFLNRFSTNQTTLQIISTWLTGHAFSRSSAYRALGVGSAMVRQALLECAKISLAQFRTYSTGVNDLSRTARLVLENHLQSDSIVNHFTIEEVQEKLMQLAEAKGSLEKVRHLASVFTTLHPVEAEAFVKLLSGDLRIGLKDGLVEEAIAKCFQVQLSLVKRAHMLTGDLGETAFLAKEQKLETAQLIPQVPIQVMLASPEPDSESIWQRVEAQKEGEDEEKNEGEERQTQTAWVEHKYDGIRLQLHKKGGQVSVFSRDLRPLNANFPEIIEAAKTLPDCILDGELIAYEEGKKLTFFDLQKRLGKNRNQGDLFLGNAIPVEFVAFDCLWSDGQSHLDQPLIERRKALELLKLEHPFHAIERYEANSPEELDNLFKQARAAGNEGLIIKDPSSHYTPGRRGKTWLKLKKAEVTLDCVIVAAEQGHGKRAELLSDYTFAVRDEVTGALRTIGKAYSGLTDLEIEELTEELKLITIEKKRRKHLVEPKVVLEIAFDSLNKSKRHDSGLAMRFPRIKALRRDKAATEIDTLQFAQTLV